MLLICDILIFIAACSSFSFSLYFSSPIKKNITMESRIADLITDKFNVPAYQLLEKIGEGGFGRVYRAKQTNTGQIVAIKFLLIRPEFDQVKKMRYIERFERETILGSRLQHPNIVRLLDKGSCDDLLYAVFEYVDGKTLKQTLAEFGAFSPLEAAEVMTQVLDALAHAHQQGVIHRDIKPANIMLSKSGAAMHVKVLDFGIGTLVSEERLQNYKSITLTQETLGTPSYSAPEQLRGEPPTLKTDLYVWGLVFIECFTGQPAMSGSSLASIFHKQLSQSNVPLPSAIIGHPISALLRRVLQKKAHERSVNANELYKELLQINFSNLVGEVGNPSEKKNANNTTVLCGDFDETVINDQAQHPSRLTERKQVTVLSLCLTGHSLSAEAIDYEVLDALLRDQKNQCVDTAIRYGAFHVGSLGDTLLFYFGYPVVSDNDSRLCARTALDIISCLHNRNALLKNSQGVELEIRCGIHTGLMTCYADAVPEGNTANIAMQLAHIASRDQILCSLSSRKLLESYIEFKPALPAVLGVDLLKTPLFYLTAERFAEAFGFLRATQNNHAFIGRQQELELLTSMLNSVHGGISETNCKCPSASKFVHIYGEAGIGKSRLLFELRNRAHKAHHYVAQCLPEQGNNALYPILNIVKYKYAFSTLSPEVTVKKLRNEIAKFAQLKEQQSIPVLCSWLNLPLPEGMSASAFSPDLQKRILFASLTALLVSQDANYVTLPNLFLFEDMHWADPTSIEFIASLHADSDFSVSNNIFISTSRQPLPQSLNDAGFQNIKLVKLSPVDTCQFVCNLFDKRNVSDNLLEVLKCRTDGIPLFIEELVNMLKQNGLIQHLNGIVDFVNADMVNQLPNSLRDSLQQKLDALVYAKETAQLAATIGREFAYDLLVVASKRSESQIQNDLNELIEAGIVFHKRKVNGANYIFKHALVKDAAYDSMLRETRVKTHQRVATSYDSHFPEYCKKNPSVIATHYANALLFADSVKYGLLAARLAMSQSSESYAVKCLQNSLLLNGNIQDLDLRCENELAINSSMIPALMVCDGYGAKEFDNIAKRSNEIFEIFANKEKSEAHKAYSFNILWGVFLFHNNRSSREMPFDLAMQMRDMALENEDLQQQVFADVIVGFCDWNDGRFIDAKLKLENAIAKYDCATFTGEEFAARFGLDPKSWALAILSFVYWSIGYTNKTFAAITRSIAWAEKINHLGNLSYCNTCYSILLYQQNDKQKLLELEKRQTDMENKFGSQFIATLMRVPKDWAAGTSEYSIDFLDQYWKAGLRIWATILETILASILLEKSQVQLALTRLQPAFAWALSSGEHCYLAKMYLLQAMLQAKVCKGYCKEADQNFTLSIKISVEQGIYYQALESALAQIDYQTSTGSTNIPNEMLVQLDSIIENIPEEHVSVSLTKALQIINKNCENIINNKS